MSTTTRGRSVAVVGAGPAGLYLLAALADSEHKGRFDRFDVYESTPAPYGLIRYGVAPDHPRTRSITRVLVPAFSDPRVRYRGNVEVGSDVSLEELRQAYDVVVVSTGMRGDRQLGIPGEDLPGSYGASVLVAWYTGHPAAEVDTIPEATSVAVIGAGNVALDIARILTREPADLAETTMPRHVVDRLTSNIVTDTHIFARRGPAVAKFTSPELHELEKLTGVSVIVDPADLEMSDEDKARVESDRKARVIVDRLRSWADQGPAGTNPDAPRRIHLHFHRRPTRILGADAVTGIEVESTRGEPVTDTYDVQLVVRAIGYDTPPFPGLPYDYAAHIVPSVQGRVRHDDDSAMPGVYVTGWLRRGPSGVIATNRPDAGEVAAAIVEDLDNGRLDPAAGSPDDIDRLLTERGVDVFGWDDWLALDAHEHALGADLGIDAVVVHDRATMLARRWRT